MRSATFSGISCYRWTRGRSIGPQTWSFRVWATTSASSGTPPCRSVLRSLPPTGRHSRRGLPPRGPRPSAPQRRPSPGVSRRPTTSRTTSYSDSAFRLPIPRARAVWSWRSTSDWPATPAASSSRFQEAAVAALGATYGGLAVLDAEDGSVLAVAGIAFSGPQPPGSTFKLITTTAALEADVVHVDDEFPIQTSTVVEGREIDNAHSEACGGTFTEAFAESCNSVFAPLGPKVGSNRLVGTAESYGFNSPPTLYTDSAIKAAGIP